MRDAENPPPLSPSGGGQGEDITHHDILYPFSAIILTKSLILHENPHSLSYQENTFTIRFSITFVSFASKMEE